MEGKKSFNWVWIIETIIAVVAVKLFGPLGTILGVAAYGIIWLIFGKKHPERKWVNIVGTIVGILVALVFSIVVGIIIATA